MIIPQYGEEQRKRKVRKIFFTALGILAFIWTIKLSFPQHLVPTISNSFHSSNSASRPDSSQPALVSSASLLPQTSNKVAVIIETRFRSNLIPLILHFSTVLGPNWPIIIYTSSGALPLFSSSASLARHLKTSLISIRLLPSHVVFSNSNSVNRFMTQPWLWENLAPADHVLIFQSDSMLCANAALSVDDFLEYDLVGAPIAPRLGHGFNGGLSLRNRKTILRILGKWKWEDTMEESDSNRFEDQYYYHRMVELQAEEEESNISKSEPGAINLPSIDVAKMFAVETIDYPRPLGVHQVHRWLKESEQELSLDEWCPEYKLCSTEHIIDSPDEIELPPRHR